MGRSRDIADILSKTELASVGNEALITTFDAVDSAYVSANSTPALVFYSTLDSLPVSGLSVGQQAYVSANNRLYISDGSGWYNKALITLSPTMTLDPTGTITLATDGITTSTVTIVANDSDTPGSGLTYSVESDGNMLGRAVISQDSSVFTIRPLSSDSGATAGTFTLTFRTSDGVNLATDSADFSLTFSTTVDSSAETVLLMKAAGNSATNADITYQNSSDVSTGFTETGDPTASTFSPYRSGGYSTYHDGTGDTLTIPSSADFAYGTGDFTWEAWIYVPAAKANHYLLDHGSNGGTMNIANTKVRYYNTTVGIGSALYTTGGTISYNTWHHVAFVRSSGTTTIYIDGVAGSSGSDGHNYGSQAVTVGDYGSGGYGYAGYIRDLRLVKGTAVYTSAFTPPTKALTAISGTSLLVSHLPYIADGSSTGHTVTANGNTKTAPFGPYDYSAWTADDVGGSVYFDGNDYVTATVTGPGTSAFTYEAWVYWPDAQNANHTIFDGSSNGFAAGGILVSNSSGGPQYTTSDGIVVATPRFKDHVWHHIAFVRDGSNNLVYYLDGKAVISGGSTFNGNLTNTTVRIGATQATTPSNYLTGYIKDARITHAAVYTAEFTPPTAPLGHITNTELLMNNNSDANIYDASASRKADLVGGTVTNNSVRKFTTSSSIYFPGPSAGTDGILIVDDSGPMSKDQFLTSDFTIEFWMYPTSWFNGDIFMGYDVRGGQSGSFLLYQNSGMKLYADNDTDTAWDLVSNASIFSVWTNSWKHFAMTYDASATTLKFYIDGVLQYTNTGISGWENGGSDGDHNVLSINQGRTDTNRGAMVGYIQDVRVSKSVRYTANFTPPTTEFEL
jgi:hypothetical protein